MEYVKLTGDMDKEYVQVVLPSGINFYAPVVTMGTTVTAPSARWINENKNKVLAIVDYIKDDYDKPIIIGFKYLEGADTHSTNSFENLLFQVRMLVTALSESTIMTSSGAQPFMPETRDNLAVISEELTTISNQINNIYL